MLLFVGMNIFIEKIRRPTSNENDIFFKFRKIGDELNDYRNAGVNLRLSIYAFYLHLTLEFQGVFSQVFSLFSSSSFVIVEIKIKLNIRHYISPTYYLRCIKDTFVVGRED